MSICICVFGKNLNKDDIFIKNLGFKNTSVQMHVLTQNCISEYAYLNIGVSSHGGTRTGTHTQPHSRAHGSQT
jgi:hypothetical protein